MRPALMYARIKPRRLETISNEQAARRQWRDVLPAWISSGWPTNFQPSWSSKTWTAELHTQGRSEGQKLAEPCALHLHLPNSRQIARKNATLGCVIDHIDPCAFGIQISNVSFPNLLIFSCSPLFPANSDPTDCVVALKTLLQGQMLNICIDRDGNPTSSIFRGDMTQLEQLRGRIVYQSLITIVGRARVIPDCWSRIGQG